MSPEEPHSTLQWGRQRPLIASRAIRSKHQPICRSWTTTSAMSWCSSKTQVKPSTKYNTTKIAAVWSQFNQPPQSLNKKGSLIQTSPLRVRTNLKSNSSLVTKSQMWSWLTWMWALHLRTKRTKVRLIIIIETLDMASLVSMSPASCKGAERMPPHLETAVLVATKLPIISETIKN